MRVATFHVVDKRGHSHLIEDTGAIAALHKVEDSLSVKRISEFHEVPVYPRLVRGER